MSDLALIIAQWAFSVFCLLAFVGALFFVVTSWVAPGWPFDEPKPPPSRRNGPPPGGWR